MPDVGPEYVVSNLGYVQLIQRTYQREATSTQAIAINAIAAAATSNGLVIPLTTGTAIRIVLGEVAISDAGATGKLTLQSVSCYVTINGPGTPIFGWTAPVAPSILGTQPIIVQVQTNGELILWNDCLEFGGIPNGLAIIGGANVSNSDGVAAHNVTFNCNYLIEVYKQTLNQ